MKVKIYRPDYQNFQQDLQVIGHRNNVIKLFFYRLNFEQEERLLTDKTTGINSTALGRPEAEKHWKPAYIHITKGCQSKHFLL